MDFWKEVKDLANSKEIKEEVEAIYEEVDSIMSDNN